jgi:hypothetical protein
MRKLLIAFALLIPTLVFAQDKPEKKETLCLPLPQLMEMLTGVGFVPVFKSGNGKVSTVVFIQADKKSLAVMVFDATVKKPEESVACLATMQENLQMNEKAFEEIMRKMVGVRA